MSDSYRRVFVGDVAQCGCTWRRDAAWGDVLVECPLHRAATEVRVAGFERDRAEIPVLRADQVFKP